MNRIATEDRVRFVGFLVEGNSIRASCRLTSISKQTVRTFLLSIGRVCLNHEDRQNKRGMYRARKARESY